MSRENMLLWGGVLVIGLLCFGCASLGDAERRVREHTKVMVAAPRIITGDINGYSSRNDTILLNEDGLAREDIQLHEYLHWAYQHLSERERSELFAVWGTEYIKNRK